MPGAEHGFQFARGGRRTLTQSIVCGTGFSLANSPPRTCRLRASCKEKSQRSSRAAVLTGAEHSRVEEATRATRFPEEEGKTRDCNSQNLNNSLFLALPHQRRPQGQGEGGERQREEKPAQVDSHRQAWCGCSTTFFEEVRRSRACMLHQNDGNGVCWHLHARLVPAATRLYWMWRSTRLQPVPMLAEQARGFSLNLCPTDYSGTILPRPPSVAHPFREVLQDPSAVLVGGSTRLPRD